MLNGETVHLWRAVDHEGKVLESYIKETRNEDAALTSMKKALKRHGPLETVVTGGLRTYPAAMRDLGSIISLAPAICFGLRLCLCIKWVTRHHRLRICQECGFG